LWAWGPALFGALLQFIASSIPGTTYPRVGVPFADKWVHMLVYGLLGGAIARGLLLASRWRGLAAIAIATALAIAYGATDEIHQRWVPYRSCDLQDLLADGLGAFIGAIVWVALVARRRTPGA
jgi:VanZ family protein